MPETCVILIALLTVAGASPSDPPVTPDGGTEQRPPPREEEVRRVMLGRFLFRSRELSGNREISCATCHEAGLSFTDGLDQSRGILGTAVGRNAPTLMGLDGVARFPGPRLLSREPLRAPGALTLEERCLVPIENPLEMGASLELVTGRLARIPGVEAMFVAAYGSSARSRMAERIGDALGAYVRTLEPERAPYHDHLDGEPGALRAVEERGRALFAGAGRCATCHAGPALTDGRVHVVATPESPRARAGAARLDDLRSLVRSRKQDLGISFPESGVAREIFARFAPRNDCGPPAATRYGGFPQGGVTETHNVSLWDVARTAPYFRDGSVASLKAAVTLHVRELQEVRRQSGRIARLLRAQDRRGLRPPGRLRPRWTRYGGGRPAPADLDDAEIDAIVAFLGALSPRTAAPVNGSRGDRGRGSRP